jgi:hypothetical protein
MSLKSTGLATYLAVTGSMKAGLDSGFLYLFSGPVPVSADDAIDGSSVMLAKISVNGDGVTGLTFSATATGGVLTKTSSEAWSSTIAATGTTTFYRFCEASDAGSASSTTAKRVQGTVGTTVASDGVLTSTSLTAGNTQTISLFQIY